MFLEEVPAGQGLYTPPVDRLPAVVIDDLGEVEQKNASNQAGLPIAVKHNFVVRVYQLENSNSAMKTRELLSQIGSALLNDSISLTGQDSGMVSLIRQPGSNSVRMVGMDSASGYIVYRGEMFYQARYRPSY